MISVYLLNYIIYKKAVQSGDGGQSKPFEPASGVQRETRSFTKRENMIF